MQATGGESLCWFVCDGDTTTAVLLAKPGHCDHVEPVLSEEETLAGALQTKHWTAARGDTILASSIVVVDEL